AVEIIGGLIQLDGFTVTQNDGRIRKIGVGKNVVDGGGPAGDDLGIGQQFFFGLAAGVRAAAGDVIKIMAINLEPRLLRQELVERAAIDGENFRFDVRAFSVEGGGKLQHLLLHTL